LWSREAVPKFSGSETGQVQCEIFHMPFYHSPLTRSKLWEWRILGPHHVTDSTLSHMFSLSIIIFIIKLWLAVKGLTLWALPPQNLISSFCIVVVVNFIMH